MIRPAACFRTKGAPPVSSANQCLITKSAGQVSYKLSADRVFGWRTFKRGSFQEEIIEKLTTVLLFLCFHLPSLSAALSLSLTQPQTQ